MEFVEISRNFRISRVQRRQLYSYKSHRALDNYTESLDEEPLGSHRITKKNKGTGWSVIFRTPPATPFQKVRRRVGQLPPTGPADAGQPSGYAATRWNRALRKASSQVAAYHMAVPGGPLGRRSTGRADATPAWSRGWRKGGPAGRGLHCKLCRPGGRGGSWRCDSVDVQRDTATPAPAVAATLPSAARPPPSGRPGTSRSWLPWRV